MSKIILCSGKIAVKKLQKVGWKVDRQKGSHVMMVKEDYPFPQHKELGIVILKKLIKQANLKEDEFNQL